MNPLAILFKHIQSRILLATLAAVLLITTGCAQTIDIPPSDSSARPDNFTLPTQQPTTQPSPVSTRVMPVEVLTPPPIPSITPIPDETLGLVVEVLDSNIIAVVLDGDPGSRAYQVKYLGIDAPSASGSNPWGVVAQETNAQLIKLKIVKLVRDKTDFDADGYLLRHVYLGDTPVSVTLLEQGLASAAITPPDTRFEAEIVAAEARAKAAKAGIWGPNPPTPTVSKITQPTPTGAVKTPTIVTTGGTITVTATLSAPNIAGPTPTLTATITTTLTVTPTIEATPANQATPSDSLQGP